MAGVGGRGGHGVGKRGQENGGEQAPATTSFDGPYPLNIHTPRVHEREARVNAHGR
jgi:hypothetical protein